jgi:hypothetical protein
MLDTEGGSAYIAKRVKELTGLPLLGVRARSFEDLMAFGAECVAKGVSVAIVDSITHPWEEVCAARLQQVNEGRRRKGLPPRTRLEFEDMAPVKGTWAKWTEFYLNSPLHIIVCGRAGYIWGMEKNEETGKKELTKEGIKMKTESEFGFEPSLLVEMEREQASDGLGGFMLKRHATVIKDRFGVIDGKTTYDPTFDFFKPHVELLKAGTHLPVDTTVKTDLGVDAEGDDQWAREKKARTILCEEIQAELVHAYPSQGAEDKKAKVDLIFQAFKTRSWTAVESMQSEKLRAGRRVIQEELVKRQKLDPGVLGGQPEAPVAGIEVTAAMLEEWEKALLSAPDEASLEMRAAMMTETATYKAASLKIQEGLKAVYETRRAEIMGTAQA